MAPKGEEETTGELVQEVPKEDEITELQVPRLVQFPGIADRLALGLSKADVEFNFRLPVCYSSATLCATAASLDLCTPPLSAQKIRRVGGGLLSQHKPLKRPQATLCGHLQGQLL